MAAENTEKTITTITLNLDLHEEAGALDEGQLIQRDAINRFRSLLLDAYKVALDYKKNDLSLEDPFDRMLHRSYNTITLHGSRGSGKTTLLNSLIAAIRETKRPGTKSLYSSLYGDTDGTLENVYVLGVVDPGIVETKENVLITIICMIKNAVDEHIDKRSGDKYRRDDWNAVLTQLSEGLTRLDGIGPSNPHESWEDASFIVQKGLQGAQGSIVFEAALSTFVHKSLDILGRSLFLIAFDDIDTAIDRGFNVLEIIRKYLATPLILTVLVGDLDLYSRIVRLQHWKKFDPAAIPHEERGIYLKKIDELEDQYMMKLLSPSFRIELLSLNTIFNSITNNYESNITYTKDNITTSLSLIKLIDDAICNIYRIMRPDEIKLYRSLILRQPTRTVMQFLRAFVGMEDASNIPDPSVIRRISDIALGPLLRNQMSSNAITSANPQQLLLLTRDFINRRELWKSGHRLFPDVRDEDGDDTNLVILALSAPLISAIRQFPSLVFDYFVKLCLPHSAFEYVPHDQEKISEFLDFISSKSYEDSRTEARQNVAVVFWKQPESNIWAIARGIIRVISRPQGTEAKRALVNRNTTSNTSIQSFWSGTGEPWSSEKSARIRVDYNTVASLAGDERYGKGITSSAIMRNIALLPFVEIIDYQSHTYTICSIFNLIGLMSTLTTGSSASEITGYLAKVAPLHTFPIPDWGIDRSPKKPGSEHERDDDDADASTAGSDTPEDPSRSLIDAFYRWCMRFSELVRDNDSINTHFLARIWSRFYFTLIRIGDGKPRDQFLGWMLHRQIIAFLSAVLIEEMNDRPGDTETTPSYENSTNSDRRFIDNLKKAFTVSDATLLKKLLGIIGKEHSTKLPETGQAEGNVGDGENEKDVVSSELPVISLDELKRVTSECEQKYPLFFALFSCPLWACYLCPRGTVLMDEEDRKTGGAALADGNFPLLDVQILHWVKWLPEADKMNDVGELLAKAKEVLQVIYVTTATKTCPFPNLFDPLSSILVAAGNIRNTSSDKKSTKSTGASPSGPEESPTTPPSTQDTQQADKATTVETSES